MGTYHVCEVETKWTATYPVLQKLLVMELLEWWNFNSQREYIVPLLTLISIMLILYGFVTRDWGMSVVVGASLYVE